MHYQIEYSKLDKVVVTLDQSDLIRIAEAYIREHVPYVRDMNMTEAGFYEDDEADYHTMFEANFVYEHDKEIGETGES